ncbi:MAG: transcriptional regulator [Planctomycetaceae bacterium]|jgi:DNA-binding MarR family transcriptional regulator
MTDTPVPPPGSAPSGSDAPTGRFAYEGLERVIHEKARLGILTSLLAHPAGLAFTELRELCSLTDGNLNRHLKVLVEAGLVAIEKMTQGNRPQTTCRVTAAGRERFQEYLAALEKVIADAASIARSPANPGLIPRWHSG